MRERYNHIQQKIKEAQANENWKSVRLWRNKLEKWQNEYGAYAPIVMGSAKDRSQDVSGIEVK